MYCFSPHLHCFKMQSFVLQAGQSPLKASCLKGHLGVVKLLIEAGANIHQVNKVNTHFPTHV